MLTSTSILKRLEALEKCKTGKTEIKAFLHYVERSPPVWKPGNPEVWKMSHPHGRALILTVKSFRKHTE
jgi:hypothetical protein